MSKFRTFNLVAGFFHLIQGVLMLVFSNDFSIDIVSNFLGPATGSRFPVPINETVFSLAIGPAVSGFLFLSALAHFVISMPKVYEWYQFNLARKVNFARWYEYALSSSLMIVVIALLCGMYDIGSLILIFSLNATMNLFGLLMEQTNAKLRELAELKKEEFVPNWTAYIFGCFAGIIPWIVLGMYFFTAINRGNEVADIPSFVYAIFYSLFVFFNIFAINMYLQYKQVGPWKNYMFGEKVYIILSLVAKSLLAWQVWGGTLRGE